VALGVSLAAHQSNIVNVASRNYQAVVIGAGPAGSSAAAMLAKSGVKVALLDRDTFPRHKLCGEFLSGESQRLLRELGCLREVEAAGPPGIKAMRFISARGTRLDVSLPLPALGISRYALDKVLLNHARTCGAEVFEGTEALQVVQANDHVTITAQQNVSGMAQVLTINVDTVIASYGRHSHLDRAARRQFTRTSHPYVGFKMHHRLRDGDARPELSSVGEMYGFPGAYCGICHVEGGRVNVCALFHQKALNGARTWDEIVSHLGGQNEAFAARMGELVAVDEPMQAAAPVPFSSKELFAGRVFYVGDAAGMISPLCGDGQAMAIESGMELGRRLGAAIGEHEPLQAGHIERLGAEWERWWNNRYARRLQLGRALQALFLQPNIAEPVVRTLRHVPGAVTWLAKHTRG
jgi:flavin-dependent dehydrogenase